jgi:hypothetical protein
MEAANKNCSARIYGMNKKRARARDQVVMIPRMAAKAATPMAKGTFEPTAAPVAPALAPVAVALACAPEPVGVEPGRKRGVAETAGNEEPAGFISNSCDSAYTYVIGRKGTSVNFG